MKILFLDQSGKLGGAELSLLDVATYFRDRALVGLFESGPFSDQLQARNVPVQVLAGHHLQVRKNSKFLQLLISLKQLMPLVNQVVQISRNYDLIYANTPKAFVVGALASWQSDCSLVYHLRDIISADHFSYLNRRLLIGLANRFCRLVIANSEATRQAFIKAGGKASLCQVVYNGFNSSSYQVSQVNCDRIRQNLQLEGRFVIGHFSRLSPWKGQHVLIEALKHCPDDVVALLVGDALFGEDDYVQQLHHQVQSLGLQNRVHFLGFRNDIPALMHACDVVAHTSTAPEPFGRVIVEAMLCGRPAIAAAAGGAVELIEHGKTGWLCPPNNPQKLAELILNCYRNQELGSAIADHARKSAIAQFDLLNTNHQIQTLLKQIKL